MIFVPWPIILHYVNPINGSNQGEKSFVLYRMEVDPENTYNYLLDPSSRENLPNKKSQFGEKEML